MIRTHTPTITAIKNCFFSKPEKESNVVGAVVIFRHGDRTQGRQGWINSYDISLDKRNWTCKLTTELDIPFHKNCDSKIRNMVVSKITNDSPYGQLTKEGMKDSFDFGVKLKSQYGHLKKVKTYSTNFPRTIMTAYAVLCGLDSPNFDIIIDDTDDIIPNNRFFGKRPKLEYDNSIIPLPTSVEQSLKINNIDLSPEYIHDFIYCRRKHGLHIPPELWDNRDTIKKHYIDNHVINLKYRLNDRINPLFRTIRKELGQGKLTLISCHDNSLVAFLLSMDKFDGEWPEYNTTIAIELIIKDNRKYVRVKRNDTILTILPQDIFLDKF